MSGFKTPKFGLQHPNHDGGRQRAVSDLPCAPMSSSLGTRRAEVDGNTTASGSCFACRRPGRPFVCGPLSTFRRVPPSTKSEETSLRLSWVPPQVLLMQGLFWAVLAVQTREPQLVLRRQNLVMPPSYQQEGDLMLLPLPGLRDAGGLGSIPVAAPGTLNAALRTAGGLGPGLLQLYPIPP